MATRRGTAASQSLAAGGSGASVTESKDVLFGVGWHAPAAVGIAAASPSLLPPPDRSAARSVAQGSAAARGAGQDRGAKIYYETKDGQFVKHGEYERMKREEDLRRADERRKHSLLQNILSGVGSVTDDDAKHYDAMIRYITGKTIHLTRLLSAVCAGVSFLLLFIFFYIGEPTNAAFTAALQSTVVATVTAAPAATGSALSANATVSQTVLATPFGGSCQLAVGDCFALYAYVNMYRPVSYFFLVTSIVGCLMSLAPLAYTTSLGAPHRAAMKRLALLQRTIDDPHAEPSMKRAAMEAVAKMQLPESGPMQLVRFIFNPTFLAFFGAYVGSVIVMSIEFDRRTSLAMVGINASLYSRLKIAVIIRAGFHLLATLVSMGTASATGQ